MNLKLGDVTARRSPTFSDCHYVKKIIFSLDYFLPSFYAFYFLLYYWWLIRATYVVDGRFFAHFFWKVEGSSAHTRESRAAHVCHV